MNFISHLLESRQFNGKNNLNFDDEAIRNIFCSKCLRFPEYSIKFSSSSAFSLVHTCLKGEIIESPLDSKNNSETPKFKCHYCKKETDHICIKCKYVLCEECFEEHNRVLPLENTKILTKNVADKNTFMNMMLFQYFCDMHLYKYNFYCPVCKINTCDYCKDSHIHINSIDMLELNIKNKDIIEPSNDCFKRLYNLSKIFHSCYQTSIKNSKMTIAILLNQILANNIIEFIQKKQDPSKKTEIKNDYFINIEKNSYLCKKYDDSEFNDHYHNLIVNACEGDIIDCLRLYEIKDVYNANALPKFFNNKSYLKSLKLQISNLINSMESIIEKYNISEINLNLSKCFAKISNLKLKNELNAFSFELLKKYSIEMNNKLDFELRRKVGNILGLLILQNFHENINTIKPTKYLLTLSNEKIAEDISNIANSKKKNRPSVPKTNGISDVLKTNFIKSLDMLITKAQQEMNKFDYDEAKNSKVIITFKSKNNEEKEINKAIICNLFFYIKKKYGDVFNIQIHNTSHSINSTIAKELKKEDTKKEEKSHEIENKDNIHLSNVKNPANGIQSSEAKIEENKNVINVNNIKLCFNMYRITEKLNKEIEIKEEFPFETNYESLKGDEDSIIDSSIKEFAKILEKMKSTFSISTNITLQQSLELYLEGRKGEILEKSISIVNLKNIINECNKNLSSNNELKEIKRFCDEFERKINKDYNFLYKFLEHIIVKIGEVEKIFDIKTLLDKYDIKQPIDLLNSFSIMKESLFASNCPEEIYYLCYVISYFLVISYIKALNKVKDEFNKIGLNKLIENNISKQNLISKYIKEVNTAGENILNKDIWKDIQECDEFVEDKDMNEKICNYVKIKKKNDYKKELLSLLEPYVKNINLDERDPQNIFLDSFMKQNDLFFSNGIK